MALRGEIAALKATLVEQQSTQSNDGLIRNVEEMLRGQVHELHNQIAQNQRGGLEWENQIKDLRVDFNR